MTSVMPKEEVKPITPQEEAKLKIRLAKAKTHSYLSIRSLVLWHSTCRSY